STRTRDGRHQDACSFLPHPSTGHLRRTTVPSLAPMVADTRSSIDRERPGVPPRRTRRMNQHRITYGSAAGGCPAASAAGGGHPWPPPGGAMEGGGRVGRQGGTRED